MPDLGLLAIPGQPPVQSPDLFPFQRLMRRFIPMERVRELYRRAQQPANRSILENLLSEMRVECRVANADLARVPLSGPVVVTCNHPFGLLDGAVVGALLARVRPDVKVLTNVLLAEVPELHEHCIFVDPFGGEESVVRNRRGVRQAIGWLRAGGMLAMFPAGEVSHLRWGQLGVMDPQWNAMAARLVRLTGAAALPVFLPGCNSAAFQALGLIHPGLRTAWLMTEFLGQTDREVEVRIGSRVPAETIRGQSSDREAADYLRWRTYILSRRHPSRPVFLPLKSIVPRKPQQPIIAPIAADALLRNLQQLNPAGRLYDSPEFSVYCAKAREIPEVLQEIGRLREVTFRAAGEGTGLSTDLDRFDHYYSHIILWSKANRELVGAYRIGLTTEILPRMGVAGLYTSTLFRYSPALFERFGPALELGRSFVRPEYQRQYSPLLTLWKGIGRYLALHPQFAVLFGAVSISNRYCRWSRELIVRFFQSRENGDNLSDFIRPRRPFRTGWAHPGYGISQGDRFQDLDQLTDPIADVETDGKSIPILVRQYARLGGRLLSFNVDKAFSNVLDGFVLVDLRRTDPAVLGRYLGEDGLKAFLSYHGLATLPGH